LYVVLVLVKAFFFVSHSISTRRTVMDPVIRTTEERLYLKFYEHLGIMEPKKMTFLCSLLRNLYDAASKLDLHLAPYGASLHCAVSRMVVSANPQEAPTHRWIRVVDRLGFFTDADRHSERIVNLGLAFAYRHLEADALAEASALLMRKAQAVATQHGDGAEGAVPRAGAVVSAAAANPVTTTTGRLELEPGGIDDGAIEEEEVVPRGGLVISANKGSPRRNAGDAGGEKEDVSVPRTGLVVSTTPRTPIASLGAGKARGQHSADGAVGASEAGGAHGACDGSGKVGDSSSLLSGAAADLADLNSLDVGDENSIPSHVLYEKQPQVTPPMPAVKAVAAVLSTVMDKPDGKEVLLKLLSDGVLLHARSLPEPPAPAGTVRPTGTKADAAAIWRMCKAWWPHWKAPQDLGSTVPPEGTLTCKLNRKRLAKSSRWSILVDMSGINRALEEMSVKSSSFFKKDQLPAVECVQRVSGKAPMKLTVVLACLLLLVTKEENFSAILSDLAFAGRADVQKNAPLMAASRHEFSSAGLTPASSTNNGTSATVLASTADAADRPSPGVLEDERPQDLLAEYASMATDVAMANSKEATRRRAARSRAMKAKQRPCGARARDGPAASAAPRAATPSTGNRAPPPATSSAPSGGGAPQPRAAPCRRLPPRRPSAGGGAARAAPMGVNVVQYNTAAICTSSDALSPAQSQFSAHVLSATASTSPPAHAAAGSGGSRAVTNAVRVPARQGLPGPQLSPIAEADVLRPPAIPLETAGAVLDPAVAGAMRGSGHPIGVSSDDFSRPASAPAPSPVSPYSSFILPAPSVQTEGNGTGGSGMAEETRQRHARVAHDMASAQASIAHLVPLRFPSDAQK